MLPSSSTIPETDNWSSQDSSVFDQASRRILIPVTWNENSERAFYWYVKTLHQTGDGLGLIHVLEPYPIIVKDDSYSHNRNKRYGSTHATQNSRALGEKYLSLCNEHGINAVMMSFLSSEPGEHIINAAKKYLANLIVISGRQKSGLKTLFGSVTNYIIHHSPIPVAVVPPEFKI